MSFITQVERPSDQANAENPTDENGKPRPSRKPKLKLELDNSTPPAAAAPTAPAKLEEKVDADNRVYGLGKIFSRQFTPTVPKSNLTWGQDRAGVQSPKNNLQGGRGSVQSPKHDNARLSTHNEDGDDPSRPSPPTKEDSDSGPVANIPQSKRTLWQSIWSCFLSDQEARPSNMQTKPDLPPSGSPGSHSISSDPSNDDAIAPLPEAPAVVGSPRGGQAKLDIPPVISTPTPVKEDNLLGENTSGKKMCLVLDLDETLVHSSFKPVPQCDFILNIEMDNIVHKVYVLKRPGVDEFMRRMAQHYELVVFTASLDKYADPLLDLLDPDHLVTGRLFREHCTRQGQTYVKDLARLGRHVPHCLIVDNSPYSYAMHMNNAIPILSWFDDPQDTELLDMIPFLENLVKVDDVSHVLDANKPWRVTNKRLLKMLNE